MKRWVFLVLSVGCAYGMFHDGYVHSVDTGETLLSYWQQFQHVDRAAICYREARALYDFIKKNAKKNPRILSLTPQQLAQERLADMYNLIHPNCAKINIESLPALPKKTLIEETGGSIQALARYLVNLSEGH